MTESEFRHAFQAHQDALYRFAYRLSGSASVAEDIVQECFLALWRNSARYNATHGPLRPFLLAVVRNLALKHWRQQHRWEPLDSDIPIEIPPDESSLDAPILVAQAVQALPPLQREVLLLAEYEELSLDQIARIVDAEVGAVKSRLHRARENLRKLLAPLRPTVERHSKQKCNH